MQRERAGYVSLSPHHHLTLRALPAASVIAQWIAIILVIIFGNTLYTIAPPDQMMQR